MTLLKDIVQTFTGFRRAAKALGLDRDQLARFIRYDAVVTPSGFIYAKQKVKIDTKILQELGF
jgi:hypothetical protein